jgi:hypothetical protein
VIEPPCMIALFPFLLFLLSSRETVKPRNVFSISTGRDTDSNKVVVVVIFMGICSFPSLDGCVLEEQIRAYTVFWYL